MKFILPILFILLFSGCLYFNEKGVSGHLYDNCQEYYDHCGIYHKECPPNIVNYAQIKEGAGEVLKELKSDILNPKKECCEPEPCTQ